MIHTVRELDPKIEACPCAVCISDVAYLSVCLFKREPEKKEIIRVRA